MTATASGGATRAIAAFVAGLELESLPRPVIGQAKRLLLDTVGCILGGHAAKAGRLAVAWADRAGGRPESSAGHIVGRRAALAPMLAAYANGRLAAVLDADETWPSARQTSHLAAAAVTAALATTEAMDGAGRELVVAIVAGYEVGARVSDAMVPEPGHESRELRAGWGPGSPIGAAVAAARARCLDASATAHAIGIAGMHVDPPPLQWTEVRPAPMAKSADAGWHALAGVAAGEMAELGLTAYDAILDGNRGLWRSLGYVGCDLDALTGGLGVRWRILDAAFKRWPSQYWMQPALTALQRVLSTHDPDPAEIRSIVLATNEKSFSAKFHDPDPPGEIDRAFSFPQAAAMLVLGVPPGARWLAGADAAAPAARRLRGLVRVELHPDAARIEDWIVEHQYRDLPARATVVTTQATLTADARFGMGAPWSEETRLSDEDLIAKTRQFAEGSLRDAPERGRRVDEAIAWILEAEAQPRVAALSEILAGLAEPAQPA